MIYFTRNESLYLTDKPSLKSLWANLKSTIHINHCVCVRIVGECWGVCLCETNTDLLLVHIHKHISINAFLCFQKQLKRNHFHLPLTIFTSYSLLAYTQHSCMYMDRHHVVSLSQKYTMYIFRKVTYLYEMDAKPENFMLVFVSWQDKYVSDKLWFTFSHFMMISIIWRWWC